MANLVVRNVDEAIVKALKAKAGLEGISAKRSIGKYWSLP